MKALAAGKVQGRASSTSVTVLTGWRRPRLTSTDPWDLGLPEAAMVAALPSAPIACRSSWIPSEYNACGIMPSPGCSRKDLSKRSGSSRSGGLGSMKASSRVQSKTLTHNCKFTRAVAGRCMIRFEKILGSGFCPGPVVDCGRRRNQTAMRKKNSAGGSIGEEPSPTSQVVRIRCASPSIPK